MSDSTTKRERFGRYLILDHLVDGGMAKICRARFLGEQADKVVAIKMVQPQFSKDEAFKTMFMDEIKVTFGLLHPNIIQTYDYGMNRGSLFVAMEYCDGRNLKEYLDKLRERKFVFPVEISTYIISQACQGLYYAHTFRDKLTGQEANIIHRDISPHNIMLTYDGSVKIIDFGIAKSQSNSESTQAGTIKGKLSYLAPEYLEGLELDPRYDQFALGITLWEMLCSRKLFKENNDLAVLKKIQECKIPVPSSINPNVPKELDEIVLKALSKNRKNRFENLDQMNRALMKFLYSKYPDFNATDLSYFAQELFREEIKKDHEKMFEFGKIDIRPYLEDLRKETEGGIRVESSDSVEDGDGPQVKREAVLDFGFEEKIEKKKNTITVRKSGVTQKPKKLSESTNVNANHAGHESSYTRELRKVPASSISSSSAPKKVSEGTRVTSVTKSGTTKVLKNEEKKKTSLGAYVALFAILIGGAFYFKSSFMPEAQETVAVVEKAESERRKPATNQNEAPSEAAGGFARMTLSHFDKQKMEAYVNDKLMPVDFLNTIKAPVGKPFTLRIQIVGRKHYIEEMNLQNNSEVEVEVPDMPYAGYAYVIMSQACRQSGEIRFEVYGEKRKARIPLNTRGGIPFPLRVGANGAFQETTHRVFFKKTGEQIEKKVEINFKREDQAIDLCELL